MVSRLDLFDVLLIAQPKPKHWREAELHRLINLSQLHVQFVHHARNLNGIPGLWCLVLIPCPVWVGRSLQLQSLYRAKSGQFHFQSGGGRARDRLA